MKTPSTALRIVFAGTPEFAASGLQALLDSPHQVVAVYTQPDRPAGRGRKLQASPVKQLAEQHQLPVLQPTSLKGEAELQQLNAFSADLMVVAAYGLILPQAVLDAPRYGCLNIHASLLPRWRGAAPIQRAIEAGDRESGITIMQMDAGLDTGAMLHKRSCEISATDTGGSLHDRLAQLGAQALLEVLSDLPRYRAGSQAQDADLASYAEKLSKQQARIDWSLDAASIERRIRAFNPWPVASTQLQGNAVRIWQAELTGQATQAAPGTILKSDKSEVLVACADQALRLTRIQLPGSKALPVAAVLNSRRELFALGERFQ